MLFEIPYVKKKKKIRNDAKEPVPSGICGWDCSAPLEPSESSQGRRQGSGDFPFHLPPPSLVTSVGALAQFQLLLQPFSSHLQDAENCSRCHQNGDPCVYCILLWLYGGKEGGEPTFVVFLHTSLLLPLKC